MTTNWMEESRELLFEQAKLMSPLYERMQDPEYYDDVMKARSLSRMGPSIPATKILSSSA